MTQRQHDTLYELADRQWQRAVELGGVHDGCTAWMQAPEGQQLLLCLDRRNAEFWIDPVDFASRRLTDGGWATRHGAGVSVRGERTYTPVPGMAPEYVRLQREFGRPIRGDEYGKFEGSWVSEFGTLNQYVHLWSYQDAGELKRAGAAQRAIQHGDSARGQKLTSFLLRGYWQRAGLNYNFFASRRFCEFIRGIQ